MPHDIDALLAHIRSLERKVKYFEQHHQCCPLNNLGSPSIDKESDVSSGDNNQSASPGFKIIPYKHDAIISKPREPNPKWRKAANQLLENVQSSAEWIAKLKSSNDDETASIITDICGVPSQVPGHGQQTPDLQDDDGVMASAKAYARATKVSQDTASHVLKIHTFRVLVFVSLCAVLEALDYPVDDINEVMRICVSNSSDMNLKRLRSGAVWVNHRIAELNTALGGHATEWFFEYGISVSQYSLLAANNSKSASYVSAPFFQKCRVLSDCAEDLLGETEEGSHSTPLSIPAFINVLARDELKVLEICDALGYSTDTELTTQLCHTYANLCDFARGELAELGTRKRKRNLKDAPGTKRQMAKQQGTQEIRTQLHSQDLGQIVEHGIGLLLEQDRILLTSEEGRESERGEHDPTPAWSVLASPLGGWGESSGMDMLVAVAEAQQAQENEGDTQRIVTVDQVNDSGTANLELTSRGMGRSGWIDPTQPTSDGYDLMNFASLNDPYEDILPAYDLTMFTSFELQDSPPHWLNQQE